MYEVKSNETLHCVAKDKTSGEDLFEFMASEYAPKENSAGYVSGGIASGGQKYQIKTKDARVGKLVPYYNTISVEGIEYMLTFLKIRKADLPFAYEWQRGQRMEYVLELQ